MYFEHAAENGKVETFQQIIQIVTNNFFKEYISLIAR